MFSPESPSEIKYLALVPLPTRGPLTLSKNLGACGEDMGWTLEYRRGRFR